MLGNKTTAAVYVGALLPGGNMHDRPEIAPMEAARSHRNESTQCAAFGTNLDGLCRQIENIDRAEAKNLPVEILRCLTSALNNVEIGVYVEECLPTVWREAHAFLRSLGTFSDRWMDDETTEICRQRLVDVLRVLKEEISLCEAA
jgi:hypothetical protein